MRSIKVGEYGTAYADCVVISGNHKLEYLSIIGTDKVISKLSKCIIQIDPTVSLGLNKRYYITKTSKKGNMTHCVVIAKTSKLESTRNNSKEIHYIKTMYLKEHIADNSTELKECTVDTISDELANAVGKFIEEETSIPFLREWNKVITIRLLKYLSVLKIKTYTAGDLSTDTYDRGFNSAVCIDVSEGAIMEEISDALRQGEISINGCNSISDKLREVKNLDQYMDTFSDVLRAKVTDKFKPKFNPVTDKYDDEVLDVASIIKYKTPIELYESQLNAIQGTVLNMDYHKHTVISAECGTGKTVMAISSICSHAKKHNNQAFTTLVVCPGHITGSNNDGDYVSESGWKKEIDSIAPMSESVVINSLSDFIKLEEKIKDKNRKRSLWIIVSKDVLKSSYAKRPAVIPSTLRLSNGETRNVYRCPECNGVLFTHENVTTGSKAVKKISLLTDFDFDKERHYNTICACKKENQSTTSPTNKDGEKERCRSKIWTALNKSNLGGWVKFSDGWYHESRIEQIAEMIENNNCPDVRESKRLRISFLKDYSKYKEGLLTVAGPKKYSIGEYIRKRFRNEIDYALFDEVHELAGDTIQGKALADICLNVWKTLSLTGTLFNGRADFIFYLLYRFNSNDMQKEGYEYHDKNKFSQDYGVTKHTSIYNGHFRDTPDMSDARMNKFVPKNVKKASKKLPGISPLIFSRFLLNNTVFLRMSDISNSLAPYNEYPIAVNLDDEMKMAYNTISNAALGLSKIDGIVKISNNKALKNALMYANMFLDQPYGLGAITTNNNEGGKLAFNPINLDENTLRPKELELLRICKEKKEKNEKFLVYYNWSNKLRIADRLVEILEKENIKVINMPLTVKNNKRQEWILDKLDKGYDGVVLNPEIISTGVNLLPCTTIIFYEFGVKAFVMKQASRRSWRLNQDKPVSVYFLYYKDTVQEQTLALMSAKIRASAAIEGDFSESGLAAMSQNDDIITELASSLVKGEAAKLVVQENTLESAGVDINTFKAMSAVKEEKKKNRRHRKDYAKEFSLGNNNKDTNKDSLLSLLIAG